MRKSQLISLFVIADLLGASQFAEAADPAHPDQSIVSPAEAISRLKEGNGRYTGGNVIDDHSLGSIEYAVNHLAVRLIVVLGHQRCGAVKAAKETIAAKGKAAAHIQSLVEAIRPAVEATIDGDLEATIEANVKHVVKDLRSSLPVLKRQVDSGELPV